MRKFAMLMAAVTIAVAGLLIATEEAQALSCGDIITVDTTLTSNLGPCVGVDGLIIGANDITLDLNKKSIIGDGICPADPDCFTSSFVQTDSGVDVAGFTGVTIKNGTIKDSFRNGINIPAGSDGTLVENMKLRDDLVFAVNVFDSDDVVVRDTQMKNLAGNGLDVRISDRFTLDHSMIFTAGKARQNLGGGVCGIGNGIFIFESDRLQIINNQFDDISQSAILVWDSTNGLIDNNKVTDTNFLPCGPPLAASTDFGAITITVGSVRIVVSNNKLMDNVFAAIGLRSNPVDTHIHHNMLNKNGSGILFSNLATGTTIRNNCIQNSTTGVGLEDTGGDIVVDATNNFWGAADGPSGDGPLGSVLVGSGEEIIQTATDDVDVEPFLTQFIPNPKRTGTV